MKSLVEMAPPIGSKLFLRVFFLNQIALLPLVLVGSAQLLQGDTKEETQALIKLN